MAVKIVAKIKSSYVTPVSLISDDEINKVMAKGSYPRKTSKDNYSYH